VAIDLDKILGRVLGQPKKRQRKSRQKTAPQQVDVLEILQRVTRRQPAPAGATWSQVVAAEARARDPRPSRALHAYLKTLPASRRPAVLAERGFWLQRARKALPRQPPRGTSLPPLTERMVKRPDGQVVEVPKGMLTAIEPFAGAGLLSLALHIEGIVTVDLCEINKWAIKTQNRNAGQSGFHHFALGYEAEPSDAWTWEPLRIKGNVDLLIGGPPCQPFSQAAHLGRRKSQIGPTADDNFFPRALDWIADLQPRVVAFENVSKLVKQRKNREWLEGAWATELAHLGYTMTTHVLYAADFGTPQNRERAWVICVPEGSKWLATKEARATWERGPQPTHGKPGSPAVKRGDLLPWVPMHDRLVSGCCGGYGLVDCIHLGNEWVACRTCHSGSNFVPAPNTSGSDAREGIEQRVVKTKHGPISTAEYLMGFVTKEPGKKPRQPRYLKFAPADFAGVSEQSRKLMVGRRVTRYLSRAVVPFFSKPPDGLMIPPGLDEWGDIDTFDKKTAQKIASKLELMSTRDAAKLQDVPQWYAFEGPRSAVFEQIGNGVPVNMGRSVARFIRAAMGLWLRKPWFEANRQWPLGFWPLDYMDPCMAFPGVLEGAAYSQEEGFQDWTWMVDEGIIGEPHEVDAQARRQRPSEALQPLSRQAERSGRHQGRQLDEIFPVLDESHGINPEALWLSGWRPKHIDGAPYPFEESAWFAEYLREREITGTGWWSPDQPLWPLRTTGSWYNVFAYLYQHTFGPKTMLFYGTSVESVWPLDADLGIPEPFPADTPFTKAKLVAALRRARG
jgi:site-specific DNA-cytosine methylase